MKNIKRSRAKLCFQDTSKGEKKRGRARRLFPVAVFIHLPRCSALRLAFWLYASSSAGTCCPWVVGVVLRPYASPFGRACRPLVVRVFLWSYVSSVGRTCRPLVVRVVLGRTCRPGAIRVVLGSYMSVLGSYVSSMGCVGRPGVVCAVLGTVRIVPGPYVSCFVLACCRRARHVVVEPYVASLGVVGPYASLSGLNASLLGLAWGLWALHVVGGPFAWS